MLLHRRQDAEVALQAIEVVVANIVFDHLYQAIPTCKAFAVISFAFENTPESFHRTVVNTFADSGHTLLHSGIYQLLMKCSVGVLKASVAVEQWFCVRVFSNSLVECFKYQRIVIPIADDKVYDPAIIQIQNSAQIDLVYLDPLIPFKLRYVGQPLLVRLVCVKFTVKTVFCYVLRIACLSGTTMVTVFNG